MTQTGHGCADMPGFAGRIPKRDARQPNRGFGDASAAVRLPSRGRSGKQPAWPLEHHTKREMVLWGRLWKIPQAVMWERMGWNDVVARYCRVLAEAEIPAVEDEDKDWRTAAARGRVVVAARAEARQLEDRLGLSPLSMLRLRWVITDEETQEDVAPVVDVRQRLKVQ